VTADFDRLDVIDLSRHYGRRKALAQVSFSVEAGDLVGLLGPNGAGKSTLLGILATLIAPSAGRVEYGGGRLAPGGAALRSCIGMLGHDLFLYPELTARENLRFFAELYVLTDAGQRVGAALQHAGLEARADDPVSGFSRGMRQRLALERALLHQPRLLLLDEPFTGLDQASAGALVARLRDRQRHGCLIVLATHDLEVADGLLSRELYLRNGRLVASPAGGADLRDRYRRAVAEP
jgi:heme exporter protein A